MAKLLLMSFRIHFLVNLGCVLLDRNVERGIHVRQRISHLDVIPLLLESLELRVEPLRRLLIILFDHCLHLRVVLELNIRVVAQLVLKVDNAAILIL